MVLADLNRNFTLTLATGPVYGTTQFQRVALLRQMKRGAGSSQLTVCWSGWKSTKILMGSFIFLKYMLAFLHYINRLGSIFFQWRVLAQWMWNVQPSLSSIASSPRTEIDSLMKRGLLCSGLGRIPSISIMPAQLSRERCTQELLAQTPHAMKVWMQPRSARQKSMMKFLIKEQYESVWFVDPVSVLSCEKKRRDMWLLYVSFVVLAMLPQLLEAIWSSWSHFWSKLVPNLLLKLCQSLRNF